MNKEYIAVLDDDPLVHLVLNRITNIKTIPFSTSEDLRKNTDKFIPLALFVDVFLEAGSSGLEVIPSFRCLWPYVPIIVITAEDDDALIGRALAAGANDFIKKPLIDAEIKGRLAARVAQLNLSRKAAELPLGDIVFNSSFGQIEKNKKKIQIGNLEANLLQFLLENCGLIIKKEELKKKLWGEVSVSDNTLEKKTSNLRKILAELDSNLSIHSVYGQGICLRLS